MRERKLSKEIFTHTNVFSYKTDRKEKMKNKNKNKNKSKEEEEE